MSQTNPPLFDFFIWLRKTAGFPLTIDQYYLLRQALKRGFGLTSRGELKRLCRLLWIKSGSSSEIDKFNQYFDLYFEQNFPEPPSEQPESSIQKTTASSLPQNFSSTTASSTPIVPQTVSNPSLQIPTAIRGGLFSSPRTQHHSYQLEVKDFPVTPRELEQNWRGLRLIQQSKELTTIDIEATVQKVSQEGFFLEPVMVPSRVNHSELLLLIDSSNSMVPFELLTQHVLDSVPKEYFRKVETYYFRNCPQDSFYIFPHRPDFEFIEDILPTLHLNRTIAVIFSDGGAARGGMSRDRIQLTLDFLDRLNPWVNRITWFNPLPEERWQGTTAEAIADQVSMLAFNHNEFKQTVTNEKKEV